MPGAQGALFDSSISHVQEAAVAVLIILEVNPRAPQFERRWPCEALNELESLVDKALQAAAADFAPDA